MQVVRRPAHPELAGGQDAACRDEPQVPHLPQEGQEQGVYSLWGMRGVTCSLDGRRQNAACIVVPRLHKYFMQHSLGRSGQARSRCDPNGRARGLISWQHETF